jgi:hypothetical protein
MDQSTRETAGIHRIDEYWVTAISGNAHGKLISCVARCARN